MLHNIARTLPVTSDLTLAQVAKLKQELDRSVEAVLARWIQDTGLYRVSVEAKTLSVPSLTFEKSTGTIEATDLIIIVESKVNVAYKTTMDGYG